MKDDDLSGLMEQAISRCEESYRDCVATIRKIIRRRWWVCGSFSVLYLSLAAGYFYRLDCLMGIAYALTAEALVAFNWWSMQRSLDRLRVIKRDLARLLRAMREDLRAYQARLERGFE